MKTRLLAITATMCLLTGCKNQPDQQHALHHGRFQGIGIYPTGPLWSRIAETSRPNDCAAANLDDDEQIIVVVDSRTGEIRQCGNLSGHCIGMNPWAASPGHAAPVPLREHAADLEREDAAAANRAASMDENAMAPIRR